MIEDKPKVKVKMSSMYGSATKCDENMKAGYKYLEECFKDLAGDNKKRRCEVCEFKAEQKCENGKPMCNAVYNKNGMLYNMTCLTKEQRAKLIKIVEGE